MYYRWIVKGINNTITISIGTNRRRLVANGWLGFDGIGNAIVVAVQIQVVSNAIAIGIDWRGTKLIPDSVSIGIGKSSGSGFGPIDDAVHIGVGSNRKRVTAFDQVTDAIIVGVMITMVVDAILVGIDSRRNGLCLTEEKDLAVRAIISVAADKSDLNTGDLTTHRCQIVNRKQSEMDILVDVCCVPCVNVVRCHEIDGAQRIACHIEGLGLQFIVAVAFGERDETSSRAKHRGVVSQCIGVRIEIVAIQTLEVLQVLILKRSECSCIEVGIVNVSGDGSVFKNINVSSLIGREI